MERDLGPIGPDGSMPPRAQVCGVTTLDPEGLELCEAPEQWRISFQVADGTTRCIEVCGDHLGAMVQSQTREYGLTVVREIP